LIAELPSLIEECGNEAAAHYSNRFRGSNDDPQPAAHNATTDPVDYGITPSFETTAMSMMPPLDSIEDTFDALLANGPWNADLSFTETAIAGPASDILALNTVEQASQSNMLEEDRAWLDEFSAFS
jgi:hypothetical protein